MSLSDPAGKPFCEIRGGKILHRPRAPAPDSFVVEKPLRGKLSARHPQRCCSVAREREEEGESGAFCVALSLDSASNEMTRKPEKTPSATNAPSEASMISM